MEVYGRVEEKNVETWISTTRKKRDIKHEQCHLTSKRGTCEATPIGLIDL